MNTRMQGWKGFPLSWILTAIVLFSVCATFALNTFVSYQIHKRSLIDNTLESNLITAGELSRTTQTIIDSMQDALRASAHFFAAAELNAPSTDRQLDFLMESVPYFNSIVIADADGVIQSTSPSTLHLIGQRLTSQESRLALTSKKPFISQPYMAVTKRLIVFVSQPIWGPEGQYRGLIAGTIYLHEANVFQKILGSQLANESGSYFYVVDTAGNLIYHPEQQRIGENVAVNPAVRELMAGKNGTLSLVNTRGKPFLAGYSLVPEVKWGIVFQTPKSYLISNVDSLVSRMALIAAPLIVLLLMLAIWFSLRLSSPLNRLAHYASSYNSGETVAVDIPIKRKWNYETNELYRTISESFRVMHGRTENLSSMANTDSLTGLYNRRFLDALAAEWTRSGIPFAAIMLDLDRFKSVNDRFGHKKGDEVLVFLADMIREEKRDMDYGCRYGGEEFTLLLPNSDEHQVFALAESIRRKIESTLSPIGEPVTLSLGISSFPQSAADVDELFRQADQALYQAKENGRNQTVIYRD